MWHTSIRELITPFFSSVISCSTAQWRASNCRIRIRDWLIGPLFSRKAMCVSGTSPVTLTCIYITTRQCMRLFQWANWLSHRLKESWCALPPKCWTSHNSQRTIFIFHSPSANPANYEDWVHSTRNLYCYNGWKCNTHYFKTDGMVRHAFAMVNGTFPRYLVYDCALRTW